MSRPLLRSLLELRPRAVTTPLPPTFLLPLRTAPARSFNSTHQNIDPIPDSQQNPEESNTAPSVASERTAAPPLSKARAIHVPPAQPLHTPLDPSVATLLPVLRAQPAHFITVHIHGRPYLVTPGDELRLPFRMAGVLPGDVLRLDRAVAIASRDLTLRGNPYVDERLFECRAVVLAHESEPMRVTIKKKQRTRKTKHVKSKQRYTILRISELKIKDAPAEETEG